MKKIFIVLITMLTISQSYGQSDPVYTIGAKWTYEMNCILPDEVTFITYEITDTMTFKNLYCFVIDDRDTICVQGNKVFAIDYRLTDSLQLLFDYDEKTSFEFECFERNIGISTYEIKVDSMYNETIADGQDLNVTEVETFCAYGYYGDIDTKVYHGIGSNLISPFPCLDFCNDIGDPVFCEIGKLRCFDNGNESYRFVDYPCDSVWQIVNVIDLENEKFQLFPNPTSVNFTISFAITNENYTLKFIDLTGKVLWYGIPQKNMDFSVDKYESGLYLLQLENENGKTIQTEKLVIIK